MSESDSGADEQLERARARLGTTLRGKYRLDRVLGVGGMAAVYAATHRNGTEFAVKLLHPELSISGDLRSRFLREGHAAGAVKHPGVVSVLDDDLAEDGAAFLVMELLHGESIEAVWERFGRHLPARFVVTIGIELLDVLAAAHQRGVVHRDIKPANLLLTFDGRLKVLDFGIARLRDAAPSSMATRTGVTMGTPAFMAPEQVLGKSAEIDGRTDIWAVGATLFTLASGRLVHEEETVQQIMIAAATKPAPPLASVLPGAPPALCAAIDGALAFGREQRWGSAAVMRDALLAVSASLFGGTPPQRSLAELSETVRNAMASAVPPGGGRASLPVDARPYAPHALPSHVGHASAAAQPMAIRIDGPPAEFVTAQPVSRDSPSKRLARTNSRLVVALASLVGALVVMSTAVLVVLGSRSSPAPAVPVVATAPTVTASSQTSVEVNVVSYPAPPPSPPPKAVTVPATAATTVTVPATTAAVPSPPSPPAPVPEKAIAKADVAPAATAPALAAPRVVAPPVAAAAPSAPAKPSCFYFENGIKKWRRECLAQ
jgi:serine/threonine protein kinase